MDVMSRSDQGISIMRAFDDEVRWGTTFCHSHPVALWNFFRLKQSSLLIWSVFLDS